MNGDGFFWLQLAAPLAVLAAGASSIGSRLARTGTTPRTGDNSSLFLILAGEMHKVCMSSQGTRRPGLLPLTITGSGRRSRWLR